MKKFALSLSSAFNSFLSLLSVKNILFRRMEWMTQRGMAVPPSRIRQVVWALNQGIIQSGDTLTALARHLLPDGISIPVIRISTRRTRCSCVLSRFTRHSPMALNVGKMTGV